MNIRTLIAFAGVMFVGYAKAGEFTNESVSLVDLPSVYSSEYKVDPFIMAASELQALGKEAAIEQLIKLSRSPLVEAEKRMEAGGGDKAEKEYEEISRKPGSSVINERGKIVILCRMLFTARKGFEFENPSLGMPSFFGDNHRMIMLNTDPIFRKWQLNPIEIVDDITFLVVEGYTYEGSSYPEGAERYIRYCATNCDWSNYQFKTKTKEEKEAALRKLISSPKWEQPLGKWERDFLRKQIQ